MRVGAMLIDEMLIAVVRREGGFVHLKADKGGATKFGITQSTLSFWRGHPASIDDVKNLTETEAVAIYKDLYYNKPNISSLPDPLDDFIFDFGVNSGPALAIKALQECLGITPDGVCGPVTVAAAIADMPRIVIKVIKWRIMMFSRIVKKDPSQIIFLAGWLARTLSFL